jgi:hypothetical protein
MGQRGTSKAANQRRFIIVNRLEKVLFELPGIFTLEVL